MVSVSDVRKVMKTRIRAGGPDFDFIFYLAINLLIDAVNRETSLDITRIDRDDVTDALEFEDKYIGFVINGVQYHMAQCATWARTSDVMSQEDYLASLAKVQSEAIRDDDPATNMNYDDDDDDLDED